MAEEVDIMSWQSEEPVAKIATFTPLSDEMVADARVWEDLMRYEMALIQRGIRYKITADLLGEEVVPRRIWESIEFGAAIPWDWPILEDEDDPDY